MSGFFGFDTNVPSLGAGKFDDLDASLPDDDEIDTVNDETFGAGAVFDGDWEEAHEKLAEQLETFKYEGHGHHHTSSFGNGQNHRYEDEAHLGALREDDYHQSDTFTSQEDDLEKSLSQLVVDDDEIDDPAIMNLSKNRPIPQVPGYFIQAKNNNLDNLFGPSSPPAFLNTEHLVSPGKTNIWGSPATRESYLDPTPPTDDGGIKNLLNMLKAKTPGQSAPFQDPSIVMAGKPTPMSNARSLDELEQELINGKNSSGGPGMGSMPIPKNNNRPMTVEDLEREMRGQPIPTPPGGRPQHHGQAPIGTPPHGGYMQPNVQRMSGNNKPNMAHSTSPGQHFSSSPHAPGYSHSTAPITIAKRGTPPSSGFQAPSSVFAALLQGLTPVTQHSPFADSHSQPFTMNGRITPPTHVASPLLFQQSPWAQSNPHPMSPLALAQALRPNMNGLGLTCLNPTSSSPCPFTAHFTSTPPVTPHTPYPAKATSPLSWSPSIIPPSPISMLYTRRASEPLPPPASCQRSCSAPLEGPIIFPQRPSPAQSPLSWSSASQTVGTPNSLTSMASSFPPRLTTTSPRPWSPIPTGSPNLNGTLSPTDVKHCLAAALTSRILSSGMNGIGSPADRHGPKNIPPFLSNQPVQQRMPFPGGFNDNNRGGFNENNRGRGPHHHQGPPPPRGHPMFSQNQPGFEPRFPNDRPPGDRFQNGRHPSGDRFPPGDRYPPGPMDDRYGPGPGPGDRGFPNGDFHGRHPGDHHMERGRGFGPMDRGGRGGFNGRGRGGFDGPMDHPGRGGFDMRMRGGPPDMRGGRGGFDMRGRGRGGFHHQRWRSNSEADEDDYEMGGGGDRDVFANLMTQKEKDWIIKIQLMQIHTNDPYLDDYYYTKWQMEKLIRERAAKAGSKGEPKLVLPQLAKADGRLYKPVQFEGSLGRLTASSVHNPRQILDVRVKTNTADESGRHKEIRRFKQLLIHIEKSYDLLLEIDDVEKRAMALPESSRPPLYRERAVRIHELYELLHLVPQDDISFVQLLTVRKGTKLVARTIPFLAKEHALPVVGAILQSILSVIKRDLQDEVMAQLFEVMACVMAELELAELVLLTNLLIAPVTEAQLGAPLLSFVLQSKFGASLVWSIVSRGEVIFRTVSPVDMDVANQNDWTAFLHNLGEAAAQTPELAQPFYVFPTVPAYLQQQLGMTTYSTLEERLASALVPTTHDLGQSTPPTVQVAS